MTLPTTTPISGGGGGDDDSDMFGPPRSSPPIGYHHHRSRVPMISPKLRQREERKRILQLCAHKLERIKDSETNLRRSVCINNTYSRLTDELRREKQSRYLANLPKSETKPEAARDNNIFNLYNSCALDNNSPKDMRSCSLDSEANNQSSNCTKSQNFNTGKPTITTANNDHHHHHHHNHHHHEKRKRSQSASNHSVAADLEILDRELSAINASMPLIDPEITQGAEQLEKAVSSRKRSRSSEDESDRLVREALSQFYIPQQRLISAIDDLPLDFKRPKLTLSGGGVGCHNNNNTSMLNNNTLGGDMDLEVALEMNQSQKDFEVIMDALRLGAPSPDSCGQAAMMSETGVFHNLVVTSLET